MTWKAEDIKPGLKVKHLRAPASVVVRVSDSRDSFVDAYRLLEPVCHLVSSRAYTAERLALYFNLWGVTAHSDGDAESLLANGY